MFDKNLIAKQGNMLDGTIASVPVQCNNRADNTEIKAEKTAKALTENPNKLRQKIWMPRGQ